MGFKLTVTAVEVSEDETAEAERLEEVSVSYTAGQVFSETTFFSISENLFLGKTGFLD